MTATAVHLATGRPTPLFRQVATPLGLLGHYDLPDATDTGVVCGRCTDYFRETGRPAAKVRHASAEHVRACYAIYADMEATSRSEIWAEAYMSWVSGGGDRHDGYTYAHAIASGRGWNPGAADDDEADDATCEHGLSARLCTGPSHYPMDM